eukprot:m.258867 g.258867  ORF g.258867 m.258867 type:complete len:724 (-) comp19199_c1_seq1:35-2206(-)
MGETYTEADFAGDQFRADDLVERVSRTSDVLFAPSSSSSGGKAALGGVNGFGDDETAFGFDPAPLLDTFEQTIRDLWSLHADVARDITLLEEGCRHRVQEQQRTMGRLEDTMGDAFECLEELRDSITEVATKIVHVGDQLEGANAKRSRSVGASRLMKHFEAFMEDDADLLPPFDDLENSNLHDAADLIQKLQFVVSELPAQRFQRVKHRVDVVFEEVESRLRAAFRESFDDHDELKLLAYTLYPFKIYSVCLLDFIKEFIRRNYKTSEDCDVWEALPKTCELAYEVIAEVFRSPEAVMLSFVQEIVHTVLQSYVSSSLQLAAGGGQYLDELHTQFQKCSVLVSKLAKMFDIGIDGHTEAKLLGLIFETCLESYITLEEECLQHSYERQLDQFFQSIGHVRRTAGVKSEPLPPHDEQDTLLSLEVTMTMVHENKRSMERCRSLATPALLPEWSYKIFLKVLDALCMDHISYALGIAMEELPSKKPKTEPFLGFLHVVKDVNSIIYLLQKHFWDNVLPCVRTSLSVYPVCVQRKNQIMVELEEQLATGVERIIGAAVEWLRLLLSKEQKKADFKPPEDAMAVVMNGTCSQACSLCVAFLNRLYAVLSVCLNGKNLVLSLRELGTSFHRILLDHIKQLSINSLGGMLLTRDLTAYDACMQGFEDPVVSDLFVTLRELSALTIVRPENLAQLCEEGRLASADKGTLQVFLQLRSDFKSAKLGQLLK